MPHMYAYAYAYAYAGDRHAHTHVTLSPSSHPSNPSVPSIKTHNGTCRGSRTACAAYLLRCSDGWQRIRCCAAFRG